MAKPKGVALQRLLAANIKARRENHPTEQQWTQTALAAEMKRKGLTSWSRMTVADIENGRRPVTLEEWLELGEVFGCSPIELLVDPRTPTAVGFDNLTEADLVERLLTPRLLDRHADYIGEGPGRAIIEIRDAVLKEALGGLRAWAAEMANLQNTVERQIESKLGYSLRRSVNADGNYEAEPSNAAPAKSSTKRSRRAK